MRDEYTSTIEPARTLAAETLKLERVLNAECGMRSAEWSWLAYGLSPAEIDLMGQTAPGGGLSAACDLISPKGDHESVKFARKWRESCATLPSGTIHRPDRHRTACRGFSRVGQEGDFRGPYRQLEMSQAEAHYL